MGTRDPRVDAYIAKSADFAKPILTHIRETVHAACPDVEESMKWSMPFFSHHGPLMNMSAFKEHAAFGFWKGALVLGRGSGDDERAMGQFGRITSVKDLPPKRELTALIKKAMKLNEEGVKVERQKTPRAAAARSPRARGGAGEEQEGARELRSVPAEPQTRVQRVDRRGEARGDARSTREAGDRVDRRGEGAELEIPEAVSG